MRYYSLIFVTLFPFYVFAGWRALPFQEPLPALCLAVSGTTLIAGTPEGLYRSQNGGSSWKEANSGLVTGPVTALLALPIGIAKGSENRILAAQGQYLYHSSDGGITWIKSPGPELAETIVALQVTPAGIEAVLNLYPNLSAPTSRLLSGDGGLTWSGLQEWNGSLDRDPVPFGGDTLLQVTADILRISVDKGGHWAKVEVDSTLGAPKSILVTTGRPFLTTLAGLVMKSEDRMKTWSMVPMGSRSAPIRSLTAQGLTICVGTSYGISLSNDDGMHWNFLHPNLVDPRNQTLAYAQGYIFAFLRRGPAFNRAWRFHPVLDAWKQINWGESRNLEAPVIAGRGPMFAWDRDRQMPYLLRSLDFGNTWSVDSVASQFKDVRGMAVGPQAMVMMTNSVYFVSTNSGSTWTGLGQNPTAFDNDMGLAVANDRICLSDLNGAIWTSDVHVNAWTRVETPTYLGTTLPPSSATTTPAVLLAATDSDLLIATRTGLWQLDPDPTALRSATSRKSRAGPPSRRGDGYPAGVRFPLPAKETGDDRPRVWVNAKGSRTESH